MKEFNYEELLQILESEDCKDYYEPSLQKPNSDKLKELLDKHIDSENIQSKTVLGIDIYRYSKYKELPQNLVPFVSDLLLKETIRQCLKGENFIFQQFKNENSFMKAFINTGDGGFFIFDTPIHAIVFAIHFEVILRTFNSFHFYPKLRNIMGNVSLRYSMTYDKVYKYKNSHYGPGIITNARILSKDKLNRFLIDENSYEWLLLNINGVENLQTLLLNEIHHINEFETYNKKRMSSLIFVPPKIRNHYYSLEGIILGINNVDIQKIGEIEAKQDKMSIYNLHIQYSTIFSDEKDDAKSSKFTISLGNLNVSGISDE